ncbi:ImmA/IrrE family metallo-endopeptidase [Ectothiorhodospira mobilis]|uniref:ImmA/IrrE family metallo-endopeptidase n=1 Tax=Ectothiorhodospira mobilis TaxID=195064 RepID=UPI001905AAA1|nr:ImmA/IrrE family metallo-endopeptidase [Ectothiorhodospira mobilis]MBK1693024.1 hypothetical protein [Ectothiorhodospira mobilis]
MNFGEQTGLQFELEPDSPDSTGLAQGSCRVFLGGEPVWVGEGKGPDGQGAPLRWTWVDLLEFLGRWWPWLILEEGYPLSLRPAFPSELLGEAERRWSELADEQVEDEEEQIHRFLARHDLAAAPKGLFLPALILLRQGATAHISSPGTNQDMVRPWEELESTLEAVGEALATACSESTEPRARRAMELWNNRQQRVDEQEWQLTSGLDAEAIERFENEGIPPEEWRWPELRAVARMAFDDVVGVEEQVCLLRAIVQSSATETPELDQIEAAIGMRFQEQGKPHEQGYRAAQLLRKELGLAAETPVEPEELLRQWAVRIEPVTIPQSFVEAITAWGEGHGPVILVNEAPGSRAAHHYGRRATLAHEMAHLLLDRRGALPFAEVLGGNSPEYPEKRARAFAAEFLLPRSAAARAVREHDNLQAAADSLRGTYHVSRELLAWQILNSVQGRQLSRSERAQLERWRRNQTEDEG